MGDAHPVITRDEEGLVEVPGEHGVEEAISEVGSLLLWVPFCSVPALIQTHCELLFEACALSKANSVNPVVLSGYFPARHNSPCLFSRQWEGR